MLASVRGIVGSYLAPYSYLPKDAGAKSWSIRRHVREGKGWLWLSYREDQAAALRPAFSRVDRRGGECHAPTAGRSGAAALAAAR
jgi:hypothetical protein